MHAPAETLKPPAAEQNPAHETWANSLDALQDNIPEVAADREAIEAGGRALIDELEIEESLFESTSHTVMFAALSQRKARLEDSAIASTDEGRASESVFIRNATLLLALNRSRLFDDVKDEVYAFDRYDEAVIEKAYDKFTNVQATAELQKAIEGGLLNEVKKRLGITDENEDPFVLHVLNIGDKRTMHGMAPEPVFGDDPELMEAWREQRAAFDMYQQGLGRKTAEFAQETGSPMIPIAWMVPLQGRRHLNVTLPTAEKILHPEDVRLGRRRPDDGQEEMATLEHEYAHTQGSMALDQQLFYGIAIEERRAELFAGNKMGYQDIKGMFDFDFLPLVGISLASSMEGALKGGNPDRLYTQLAARLGLQSTLEIALTTPEAYVRDEYPMQRDIQKYLGGINGLEQRLYERMDDAGRAFFDTVVNEWATNNAPRNIESWLNTREHTFGLSFVTQRLREALQAKREELGLIQK